VSVEVAAPLAVAVDQGIVAVEDGVEADPAHATVADGDQRRPAVGDDVEAFVDAAATALRVVLTDGAANAVRRLHREDMAVVGNAATATDDLGRGRCDQNEEEDEGEGARFSGAR
jgi:hypothetical protein